jgi:hypothetical protein
MGRKKYPVHARGDRNVFCPKYNSCLDHAVKYGWEYWACLDCQHTRSKKLIAGFLLSSTTNDPYHSVSPMYYKEKGAVPL